MQYISGLIPTDQEVVRPGPYPFYNRRLTGPRQRSQQKGLLACVLLLMAFCLLLLGEGLSSMKQEAMARSRVAESLMHAPLETVAAMVGHSSAEAVKLLWDCGIHIADPMETVADIAEDNGRKTTEILAILTRPGQADQMSVD